MSKYCRGAAFWASTPNFKANTPQKIDAAFISNLLRLNLILHNLRSFLTMSSASFSRQASIMSREDVSYLRDNLLEEIQLPRRPVANPYTPQNVPPQPENMQTQAQTSLRMVIAIDYGTTFTGGLNDNT